MKPIARLMQFANGLENVVYCKVFEKISIRDSKWDECGYERDLSFANIARILDAAKEEIK